MQISLKKMGGGPDFENDVLHHLYIDGKLIANYANPSQVQALVAQFLDEELRRSGFVA